MEEPIVVVESWLAPEMSAQSVLTDKPMLLPPPRFSTTLKPMVVVPALEPMPLASLELLVLLVAM